MTGVTSPRSPLPPAGQSLTTSGQTGPAVPKPYVGTTGDSDVLFPPNASRPSARANRKMTLPEDLTGSARPASSLPTAREGDPGGDAAALHLAPAAEIIEPIAAGARPASSLQTAPKGTAVRHLAPPAEIVEAIGVRSGQNAKSFAPPPVAERSPSLIPRANSCGCGLYMIDGRLIWT
ncbi:hypothetical protein T484DRAFT_3000324 [Baffinella frigidus]|nr:hypothetical protein T484DRAFT_3000324 [Cryptophyta sp. CCMP2293]